MGLVACLSIHVGCGRVGDMAGRSRDAGRGRDTAPGRSADASEVTDGSGRDTPGTQSDAVPPDASSVPLDGHMAEVDRADVTPDAGEGPREAADLGDGDARETAQDATVMAPDLAAQTPQDAIEPSVDQPLQGDDSADADSPEAADARRVDALAETELVQVPELAAAPLIVAPTSNGFGLNVVLRAGDPQALRAHVRKADTTAWTQLGAPASRASDLAEWSVSELDAGQRYEYEIVAVGPIDGGADQLLFFGSATTRRDPGTAFTFSILTDSHIQPCDPLPAGTEICADDFLSPNEDTLLSVAADIRKDDPDFLIHMGDMLDYHLFGFNVPPPDSRWARLAYLNYRRLLGPTAGNAAHFPTIGNWEGESGYDSPEVIQRSSSQRMLYVPGPGAGTYPEGGSPNQDYYAFTWGDALFVVLNVMTYTPTPHLLTGDGERPDDWTLGAAQRAWLESTLAAATSKWRFLFIHHPVGGNAGDDANTDYGRGGGRAAYVGEQAEVHRMMLEYGVQVFFYGHDHVFTDMVVDGIHYTLPGSAGAPWKFDTYLTGYTEYWPDSGHGRVRVSPDAVQVDLIAVGGTLLSTYTLK
jgi:hypothetical protein